MIGKNLGGRYEILERIGGGGMALVYKGQDLLLHRKVAVKVLRQQYVHDEDFIRRFRREAQAAASLSHPNVVSIYDVGQEGDIHYIVMEYVEGTTLNELIKEKAPLQVEEAVHIAAQICDALDHAHANDIIHRDIKPHNILIGKNGRIKVTDFGIARAATSSQITQTGSVVGSVHYFSPEHAKGTLTGQKSDLYSLGIVLYQMLTGSLPFLGESPISVALKHLQEDVVDPRVINPLIPQSVENIILKAMRKRPEERYQSAKEMLGDIETALNPNRRSESKIQFWEEGIDEESTRVIPAIRSTPSRQARNNEPLPQDDFFGDDGRDEEKKRRWIKPLVWIIVLLLLAAGMWMLIGFVKAKLTVEDVKVPNVVGKSLSEAQKILSDANLTFKPEQVNGTEPKDTVVRQDPNSDMTAKVRAQITLYISKGVELKKMGSYKNSSLQAALADLNALGVDTDKQVTITKMSTDDPPDTVLQQSPGVGTEFDPATVNIKLSVSQKNTIKMPDLRKLSLDDAKNVIKTNKLKLNESNIKEESSYTIPKGNVIKQFPYNYNDDVSEGSEISLVVSSGLPPEAGVLTVPVTLTPSEPGKASTFKVLITDARYDKPVEFKTIKTDVQIIVNVQVTLGPDKQAVISIKENDKPAGPDIVRTYQDYLNQTGAKPAGGQTSNEPQPSKEAH